MRRMRLLDQMQGLPIEEAFHQHSIRTDLEAEAAEADPDGLMTPAVLELLRELIAQKQAQEIGRATSHLLAAPIRGRETVVIIPGCLASTLSDTSEPGHGLVWLSPTIIKSRRLQLLQLGPFDGTESDLDPQVRIAATGTLPILYDLLTLALTVRNYEVELFPVDWRKDLEIAARLLVVRLRGLAALGRDVHLVAHSQGSLVARRAVQLLGEAEARRIIRHLVLLGPVNYGSFSAALALGGGHSMLSWARRLVLEPSQGFQSVLASMSGLYQLLPWDSDRVPWLAAHDLGQASFWKGGIDQLRLSRFFGWGRMIDTSFLADRTTTIMGDNCGNPTVGGVAFDGTVLRELSSHAMAGDGTVPHSCAVLSGVPAFLAPGTEHMTMTLDRSVIRAVVEILGGAPVSLPQRSSDAGDHVALSESFAPAMTEGLNAFISNPVVTTFLAPERNGTFLPSYDNPTATSHVPRPAPPNPGPKGPLFQAAAKPEAHWPGIGYELILDACELLPFEFLRIGDRLGRAVVKIQCEDGAVGTGFLVAPGILLTNNHVLPDATMASGSYALANFETSPPNDSAGRSAVAPLDPQSLFITNADLDFTFCAVQGLDYLGTVPVNRNSTNISVLEYMNIIQHPRGRPKEVALQDNRVVKADNVVVQYACDTEPGSSGSPVFDNRWRLVALHHASVVTDSTEGRFSADADPTARYLNEGIRLSAIATWLETAEANTPEQREQVAKLRGIFNGLDPQIGFFGALGRKGDGKTAAEVVINSYEKDSDDIDIGFWNLARLSRRFREHLADVGRVVAELGLELWCLTHAHPVGIRALCDHLETNYQLNYDFILADPINYPTLAVVYKRTKTLTVGRLAWPDEQNHAYAIPIHVLVRVTACTHGPVNLHLVVIPDQAPARDASDQISPSHVMIEVLCREILQAGPMNDWVLVGSSDALLSVEDLSALMSTSHKLVMVTADRDGAIAFLTSSASRVDQIFVSPNLTLAVGQSEGLTVARDRSLPQSVTSLSRPHPLAFRLSFASAPTMETPPLDQPPIPPQPPSPALEPFSSPASSTPSVLVIDADFEQKLRDMLTPIIAKILAENRG
jgi:V8-like Glu-specific endopeptidase/pimeloyl-ACP methyl ester carboxylesterase